MQVVLMKKREQLLSIYNSHHIFMQLGPNVEL